MWDTSIVYFSLLCFIKTVVEDTQGTFYLIFKDSVTIRFKYNSAANVNHAALITAFYQAHHTVTFCGDYQGLFGWDTAKLTVLSYFMNDFLAVSCRLFRTRLYLCWFKRRLQHSIGCLRWKTSRNGSINSCTNSKSSSTTGILPTSRHFRYDKKQVQKPLIVSVFISHR